MRIAALAAVFVISSVGTASAQTTYEDPKTPEGWAWQRIRNDEIADFNTRCGKTLDPHDKTGWDDACRQISAKFVVDILTVPKWRDQLPRQIVRLRGVRIDRTINLAVTEITPEVWIDASRIEGGLILVDSHWKRRLSLRGSTIVGGVSGYRIESESTIHLSNKASIEGDVDLRDAKIGGDLDMNNSSFGKAVNAGSMSVAGSLFMRDHATFGGDVNLSSAKIGSNLEMETSTFNRTVNADRLSVGGHFLMRDHATFAGDVILRGAKIGANLEMDASSFAGAVNTDTLSVAGSLFMRDHATFAGDVNLVNAKIGGNLEMDTSSFSKSVTGSGLRVGGNLFMRDHAVFGGDVDLRGAQIGNDLTVNASSFAAKVDLGSIKVAENLGARGATFDSNIDLSLAKIAGVLDLSGATAASINLSASDVGELNLRGLGWWCTGRKAPSGIADPAKPGNEVLPVHWRLGGPSRRDVRCRVGKPPELILRNAHAAALQDSGDAWPPLMDLEGFRYDRLGGFAGTGRDDMRQRSSEDWIDWLAHDPTFSTQPYVQLSSVLAAAGHRDTSEAIQFAGRERERIEAHGITGTWLTFLSAVNGYGIGTYTVRVIRWVILLTLLGAVLLQLSPAAREHGVLWRCGASLHRLLPVIELSKDFTNFFDNLPREFRIRRYTHGFLQIYFAAHSMAGYVLGFILLAAMGGLTQKG